ncbi:hypothetical protein SHKM778_67860 [Streptomyces sp. KM77-8]|uniref:Enoyl-CoA hydratase/isomerase family protein n=1 Tax=Streptomyces haneummycinicus TaxID=3074435 RepID=A0AAT9HSY1_9ACTN
MASSAQDLGPVLDKDGVRLTVDDAIATVTLTNPAKRNAQSPALWRALTEVGRLLPGSVRVVVLRGEGKSFSAGLDRQMFTPEGIEGEPSFIDLARRDDAALDATIAAYQEAFTWWRRSDIVSIAAVQGHAIGAGFQLALACDLRVVADDVLFAMRETSLGLVPDLTGTHPWSPWSATPAPWRSARPAASSRPRSRWRPAWPTSRSPHPSWTPRRWTWQPPCWRPPRRGDRNQVAAPVRDNPPLRHPASRRTSRPVPPPTRPGQPGRIAVRPQPRPCVQPPWPQLA